MDATTGPGNSSAGGNATAVDESCLRFYVIWRVGVTGTICIVGIVGNVLCLLMFRRLVGVLSASMMLLLKALAWADLLYVSLFSLIIVWPYLLAHLGKDDLIQPVLGYCYAYAWPVVSITINLSTWYTVLISVHRYIAVLHPLLIAFHSSLGKVRRHVAATTLLAVAIDIPRFFEITVYEYTENNATYRSHQYTAMYLNPWYQLLYKTLLMVLYRKLIPLAIISVLGVRLILAVHRAKSTRQHMQSGGEAASGGGRSGEMKITLTMLAIMITFVLCQLPSAIYPIVRLLDDSALGAVDCDRFDILVRVADTLGVLNSSVNFIIYMASSSTFLVAAHALCCPCCVPPSPRKECGEDTSARTLTHILCSPCTKHSTETALQQEQHTEKDLKAGQKKEKDLKVDHMKEIDLHEEQKKEKNVEEQRKELDKVVADLKGEQKKYLDTNDNEDLKVDLKHVLNNKCEGNLKGEWQAELEKKDEKKGIDNAAFEDNEPGVWNTHL